MTTRTRIPAAMLALAAAAAATAHHSYAMFDADRSISITGTIKEFQWTNPHSVTWVSVPGAGGKEALWAVEGRSPSELSRMGWNRKSLKPGDHVSILLHPLRDGRTGGGFIEVKLADGSVLSQDKVPSLAGKAGASP